MDPPAPLAENPAQPAVPSSASPAGTAELSSNQCIIYLPLGPPHFANLFIELVIDKLRSSPFFPQGLHGCS